MCILMYCNISNPTIAFLSFSLNCKISDANDFEFQLDAHILPFLNGRKYFEIIGLKMGCGKQELYKH